jgi:F0F1-type ATP synthase assembly protein I
VEKDNENLNKNEVPRQDGAGWWKPAVEIFSRVSGYIVVPVVLALIVGKYLDNRFNTKPWIFLGLTGVAFLISSFSIVRTVSKYMKEIDPPSHEASDGQGEENNPPSHKASDGQEK